MGITTPIGKYEWCFSSKCKVKGYGIQLNIDGDPHWSLMLNEDQQENLNLNTNGTKQTMKVMKPMLGPCLLFLTESIQMSFVGLKIVKRAKEAWDILQVIHQGTFAVNISKLLMLATKVENIRMHENHNFSSFYS